jgi:peptidyl-prolyl cis-trans isomerase C
MKRNLSTGSAALPASAMVALVMLALAGCGPQGATTPAATTTGMIQLANPGHAAATVNGEEVPDRLVDAIMKQRGWDTTKPELRERALREVTNIVLTAQAAQKEKLFADPDFAAQVEIGRLQAISIATASALRDRAPVDEAALKAEYEKRVGANGKPDYDFTQIVFRTQGEAVKTIAEAKSKPFDKLVEAHQKDALQARSIKHARGAQLPEPMIRTLDALKPGEYAKEPVQSPLGFAVIRLDAVTPYTPPPFEQVKDNLRKQAQKRAGEDQLAKLRADAKIVPAPGLPGVPAPGQKPAAEPSKPQD